MLPKQVTVIDMGFHRDFAAAANYVQSIIESLVARKLGQPMAEIEFVRSRDSLTLAAAMQQEASVLHVISHGVVANGSVAFLSDDGTTGVDLNHLEQRFAETQRGIYADVVFADCCKSSTARFVREIRDCLESPTVYVGAKRSITWYESTTYGAAFYSAYFRSKAQGVGWEKRGHTAAAKAAKAYEALTEQPCPFIATTIEPSRSAKRYVARRGA